MSSRIWSEERGDGPLVAVAVHTAHDLRAEVAEHVALPAEDRFREEDPFTGEWTQVAPTRVLALRSRFEVDLNRPREKAVYHRPEDAWGLRVWKGELPEEVALRSLEGYDAFYSAMERLLRDVEREHGRFVVLDIHSYNHRRGGPDTPPEPPEANPEVNLGTGTMDRERWSALVDRFVDDLGTHPVSWGSLDVRENVKFRGGNFSRWVHETFPATGCSLAVEFRKSFMDEWTGGPDRGRIDELGAALRATVPGILEELSRA